jgi:hypothetical protein
MPLSLATSILGISTRPATAQPPSLFSPLCHRDAQRIVTPRLIALDIAALRLEQRVIDFAVLLTNQR